MIDYPECSCVGHCGAEKATEADCAIVSATASIRGAIQSALVASTVLSMSVWKAISCVNGRERHFGRARARAKGNENRKAWLLIFERFALCLVEAARLRVLTQRGGSHSARKGRVTGVAPTSGSDVNLARKWELLSAVGRTVFRSTWALRSAWGVVAPSRGELV